MAIPREMERSNLPDQRAGQWGLCKGIQGSLDTTQGIQRLDVVRVHAVAVRRRGIIAARALDQERSVILLVDPVAAALAAEIMSCVSTPHIPMSFYPSLLDYLFSFVFIVCFFVSLFI